MQNLPCDGDRLHGRGDDPGTLPNELARPGVREGLLRIGHLAGIIDPEGRVDSKMVRMF
jgi:hypothetical protein